MSTVPFENSGFRAPQGTGLGVPGGKTRFMKGATGRPGSPTSDFAKKHWGTVGISRDLHLNSPIPVAIRERLLTYVIGDGLNPEPHINHKYAGVTIEEARMYEEIIAKHHRIWESDTKGTWEQSLTPLQTEKLAFSTWIVAGDFFYTLPTVERANWPYNFAVKLIAPDFVRTPDEHIDGVSNREIVTGIERNSSGRDQFYWIANYYDEDRDLFNQKQSHKAYRVFDEDTGRKYIHHAYSPLRIDQRRGISFIAPIVEAIQAISHLSESQLIAAVVQSYFNVIVTDDNDGLDTLPEAYMQDDTLTGGGSVVGDDGYQYQNDKDEDEDHELELGSGAVTYIPGNKKIHIASPNKESNSFEPFFKAIVMQIGAAIGIAYEVLMENFTSSYSASRAAILMSFKKFFQMRKEWIQIYKKPVYESFILDLAIQGIIPVSAEELLTDPWKMSVWANIQWRGPTMGHVQPLQEVQAAELRIKAGISTQESEAKDLNPDVNFSDLKDTHEAETKRDAEHVDMLNQDFPLNGEQKITTTRAFYDEDNGGAGDVNNPKEKLKAERQKNVEKQKEGNDE
jgi:lambda family phage portal protein